MFGRGRDAGGRGEIPIEPLPDSRFGGTTDWDWTSSGESVGADSNAAAIGELGDGDMGNDDRRRWKVGAGVLAAVVVGIATIGVVTGDDGSLASPDAPTTTAIDDAADDNDDGSDDNDSDGSEDDSADTVPETSGAAGTDPGSAPPEIDLEDIQPIGYILDEDTPGFGEPWLNVYGTVTYDDQQIRDPDLQLWATPGATRTSGQWLLVHASVDASFFMGTGARGHRVAVGDRVGTLGTASDGVLSLSYSLAAADPGAAAALSVQAFGFDEPALIEIARSVTVDDAGRSFIGTVPTGLASVLHTRAIGCVPSLAWVLGCGGPPQASASYRFGSTGIEVQTHELTPDVATLLPFLVANGSAETIGHREFLVGSLDDQMGSGRGPSADVAVWLDGRTAVQVLGNVGRAALLDALAGLHRPSGHVWLELYERSAERLQEQWDVEPTGEDPWSDMQVVASGAGWSVQASGADTGAVMVQADQGGFGVLTSVDPAIRTWAGSDRTVVTAWGRTGGEPLRLRVTVGGSVTHEAATVPVGDEERPMAALAFEELGPYVAELIDADGTVIATTSG